MVIALAKTLALVSTLPAIAAAAAAAAAATAPRDGVAKTNPGFISFPIKRSASTKTLSGRQATASLINEQDTSYLIELTFGSNAQAVKVAIDTGSDELFVDPNCNNGQFTTSEIEQCEADGTYNPSTSTTSQSLDETNSIVYGSGEVVIAYYTDSIGIPGASSNLTNVQFGAATNSEDLNEGILGLGFGKGYNLNYSNFVDALQEQGVTNTKALSVALGNSDTAGGNIIFGGVDTKKFSGSLGLLDIQSPSKGDIQRYSVAMSGLSLTNSSGTTTYNGSALSSNVVLDTGSSLCELPTAVVDAMAEDFGAIEDDSGLLVVDCSVANDGTLNFQFDGVTIDVPLSDFVLQDGSYCVLGVMAIESGIGISALLGDSFLRNAYAVFDQTNMQIGLAQYKSCGTNVQAIPTGTTGVSKFTGECSGSSSSSGAGNLVPPASVALLALTGGMLMLGGTLL